MVTFGNLFTHYGYHLADVSTIRDSNKLSIKVDSDDGKSDLSVDVVIKSDEGTLPFGSLFSTTRDALKFAGPLPFTFEYEPETHSIIRVEGVRKDWHPKLVDVTVREISFFRQEPFRRHDPILCSAFYLEDIDYSWKKGVVEKLDNDE